MITKDDSFWLARAERILMGPGKRGAVPIKVLAKELRAYQEELLGFPTPLDDVEFEAKARSYFQQVTEDP